MASYERATNGKWSVRFRAFVNGNEKNMRLSGYKTRKEAEKAYADYLHGTIQPKDEKEDDITFEKLTGAYLRYHAERVKPSSFYEAKNKINKHILPTFGEKLVKDIRPLDVLNWQSSLTDQGYAFKMKNILRMYLNSIFSYGEKYYDLPNPVKKVDGFRDRSIKPEMNVWTIEQFNRFLEVVADEELRALFTLLFYCGLRKGEALALTWGDYDFDRHRLRINKSITRKEDGKAWSVTTPKNSHSVRTILVPDAVDTALTALYKRQSTKAFIFGNDRPLAENTLTRQFKTLTTKAELPEIRIHDLRHSCASHLLSNENGQAVSPVAVAKYLGHTVEMLLTTYAHILPNGEEEIVKKFCDKITKN